MTEKKLRIFKENYKKCKKKSTLKIIFKFLLWHVPIQHMFWIRIRHLLYKSGSTDPDLHHCYKCLLKFFKKR